MTQPAAAKTTAITPYAQKVNSIRELLEKAKGQIKLALPKHLSPERLLRIAMTSVQKTPELLDCDRTSLLGAVIQAAQLGLEPDGVLGHGYLIPFKGKVQFIPGYRGMIDLSRRSGQLSTIYAEVVHANDTFAYEMGLHPTLTHKPSEDENPGEMTHVYAVAKLKDGGEQFCVLSKRQVMAIKAKSAAANSSRSPWNTGENDFEEMCKKTAIRRLWKMLPVSVEMATAVDLHDKADMGVPQNLGDIVEIPAEAVTEASGKPTLDDLAKKAEEEMAAK